MHNVQEIKIIISDNRCSHLFVNGKEIKYVSDLKLIHKGGSRPVIEYTYTDVSDSKNVERTVKING